MTEEQLKGYDFIVLVDRSGSMEEADCPGGATRWAYAQEQVLQIARAAMKFDSNGITVGTFNTSLKLYENVKDGADQLKQIFSEKGPGGSTDTAGALKQVIDEYLKSKGNSGSKPIIVAVITDGRPDSEQDLRNVIITATTKIASREEIGIEFIQIGKDAHAAKFLDELNNGLTAEGAKFDIVNSTNFEEIADRNLVDVFIASLTE